jgi:hypothetical protein
LFKCLNHSVEAIIDKIMQWLKNIFVDEYIFSSKRNLHGDVEQWSNQSVEATIGEIMFSSIRMSESISCSYNNENHAMVRTTNMYTNTFPV